MQILELIACLVLDKRLQTDFVQCETHQKKFKLSDYVECSVHNSSECIISWIFGDKVILLGESHEEFVLNLRASMAASKLVWDA